MLNSYIVILHRGRDADRVELERVFSKRYAIVPGIVWAVAGS